MIVTEIDAEFVEFCRDFVARQLTEREGTEIDLSELAYGIMRYDFVDGVLLWSIQENLAFIYDHSDIAGELIEARKIEQLPALNPFIEPSRFVLEMVYRYLGTVFATFPYSGDSRIMLTSETAREIIDWFNTHDCDYELIA